MRSAAMLARELGPLARALSTTSAAASVPSLKTSGGLLSMFRSSKPAMPSMDVPLANFDKVTPVEVSDAMPETERASLPNGVVVGSQDIASPLVSVGLIVESGPVYETAATEGASQLIEAMAYTGTASRTHFATIRQAENYGVMLSATINRESTAFYATAPRDNIAAAMELICDSAMRPVFMEHILAQQKGIVKTQNNASAVDPMFMAMEGIASVAYSGALARPQIWQGNQLSAQDLQDFHAKHFKPSNTIVAASGAPLATVESLAAELLGDLSPGEAPEKPRSEYVGGCASQHLTKATAVLLAFETPGWENVDEAIVCTVVQFLLGGGSDFSTGGPGKGMHSRLYKRVLAQKHFVNECSAYANVFERTGLMGILATSPDPTVGADLVNVTCRELEELAGGVSDEEVARARNLCETQIYTALQVPSIVAEDIARQFISYGRRIPMEDFMGKLQAVDAAQVTAYARKLLSTKPSAVLLGDQVHMPKFDTITSRFG